MRFVRSYEKIIQPWKTNQLTLCIVQGFEVVNRSYYITVHFFSSINELPQGNSSHPDTRKLLLAE